jgi:ABC-type branched-chain amino acid transport system, permease component
MTAKRKRLLFLALAGLGLTVLMQAVFHDYLQTMACFVGIFIILAVSLNFTNGFPGLFSLGHPAFMAIGGYVAALLTFNPENEAPLPAQSAGNGSRTCICRSCPRSWRAGRRRP